MWQRIFTKVRGDGTSAHNYALPPQWEWLPAVAHASASLQCGYCFDGALLKMVEHGLPTGFKPTTVYVDADGAIHMPTRSRKNVMLTLATPDSSNSSSFSITSSWRNA